MSAADKVQPQLSKQTAPSSSIGSSSSTLPSSSTSSSPSGRGSKSLTRSCSTITGGLLSSVKIATGAEKIEAGYCKYTHRTCTQDCLAGYDFCLRHILEDKMAPYKQCAYMSKAGRRCASAAPKTEKKDGFCANHNRKSILARQRLARKRRQGETAESLLEELVALTSGSGSGSQSSHEHRRNKMFTDSLASRALEYGSSSDSDSEMGQLVEQTWHGDVDSDAESIDSDQEDLLKYAGIYTTEEVAQILRDKLIRLQALYIDQFKRLKHLLLSKRRQYLREKAIEKEAFGSIKLYKKDPFQREKYEKLKAMQRIHKKLGKEALLHQQATQRRIQASSDVGPLSPGRPVFCGSSLSAHPSSANFPSCTFLDEGVRCGARVVPLSKFCQKHILHDPWQLLYRPCPFADSQCGRPVPTSLNTEFCSLHQPQPAVVKIEADDLKTEEEENKPSVEQTKDTASAASSTKPCANSTKSMDVQTEDIKPDRNSLPTAGQLEPVAGAATTATSSSPRDQQQVGRDTAADVRVDDKEIKEEPEEGRNISAKESDDIAAESEPKSGVRFTLGEEDEDEDQEMGLDNQGR